MVDVVKVLTNSVDPHAYWRKLKERLLKEGGNETVTKCHGLKMLAADGKMRMTDVAGTELMLRINHLNFGLMELLQEMPERRSNQRLAKRWLLQADLC